MATAIGLLTVAGMAHSAPPSAQEIRDRLSGNTQNPATSPAQKPDPAADLCSTQEAIEANPAGCSQALSGPDRAMSLLGPIGAGHPATTAAGHPATGAQRMSLAGAGSQPKKKPVHAAAVTSGAAGCSVLDAGDSSAANLCVTFALNSAILNGQSRTSLDHLAQVLVADFPHRGVKIEGFADASGDTAKNTALSDARAHAVVDYLSTKGVETARLQARGYGATRPIAGHDPRDPANRRVEARLAN